MKSAFVKRTFHISRIIAIILICALTLSGCIHKHTWVDATCTTPKTCTDCGKTDGEALVHLWEDATCTAAKHCTQCDAVEGSPLDHTWENATYTAPKTCTACGKTEGESKESPYKDCETWGEVLNIFLSDVPGDGSNYEFSVEEWDTDDGKTGILIVFTNPNDMMDICYTISTFSSLCHYPEIIGVFLETPLEGLICQIGQQGIITVLMADGPRFLSILEIKNESAEAQALTEAYYHFFGYNDVSNFT